VTTVAVASRRHVTGTGGRRGNVRLALGERITEACGPSLDRPCWCAACSVP